MILSVLYYGGKLMNEAQISVGDLSSFLLYAVFVGISLSSLTSFYAELMRGLGASTRIFELMDRVPLIPSSGSCTKYITIKLFVVKAFILKIIICIKLHNIVYKRYLMKNWLQIYIHKK